MLKTTLFQQKKQLKPYIFQLLLVNFVLLAKSRLYCLQKSRHKEKNFALLSFTLKLNHYICNKYLAYGFNLNVYFNRRCSFLRLFFSAEISFGYKNKLYLCIP